MGKHQSNGTVVRSDVVSDVELDRDVFSVAGTDLRIVAHTAASGSEAAAKLDFLRVSAGRCGHAWALTPARRAI